MKPSRLKAPSTAERESKRKPLDLDLDVPGQVAFTVPREVYRASMLVLLRTVAASDADADAPVVPAEAEDS